MIGAGSARALLERDGRVWFRGLLSDDDLSGYDDALDSTGNVGGRLALDAGLVSTLSSRLVAQLDAGPLRATRMVAFTKSEAGNWGVPWHQDCVIAVSDRTEVPGFGNWSQKRGVWHCEPPVSILEEMLFVRVHLDDAMAEAGAMQIAVGSHRLGRVAFAKAEAAAMTFPIEDTQAQRGDVLVMHMLLLHRSLPAQVPQSRRVMRVDFARSDLPAPLNWPKLSSTG